MLLGNDYVAEGRSRQAEQSKFMSMREVAKRHSSMIDSNSGGIAPQNHLKGNSPHRSGIDMTAGVSSSVKSFSPPPNLGDTPQKHLNLQMHHAPGYGIAPEVTLSPQGSKTMKHASLKVMQLDAFGPGGQPPVNDYGSLHNSQDFGLKYPNTERKDT